MEDKRVTICGHYPLQFKRGVHDTLKQFFFNLRCRNCLNSATLKERN